MLNWLSIYYLGNPTANGDITIDVVWSDSLIPIQSINIVEERIDIQPVIEKSDVEIFISLPDTVTVFLEES